MAQSVAQVFAMARSSGKVLKAADTPAVKDLAEAYAAQTAMIASPCNLGSHVGWKNGMTVEAQFKSAGFSEPWRAPLFSCCLKSSGAEMTKSQVKIIEGEFGFTMKSDLAAKAAGATYSESEVSSCVDSIFLAIETIAPRATDPATTWVQKIADGGANSAVIQGPSFPVDKIKDLDKVKVTLEVNGAVVDEGTGANVLGHPLKSLTWLANNLLKHGTTLKKGQVIITGAAVKAAAATAQPGDVVMVRYEGLGSVHMKLVPGNFLETLEHAKAVLSSHGAIVTPTQAKELITQGALVLDVQDGPLGEAIPSAVNVSLGTLPFRADAAFADGAFKVVTCGLGGQALLAGLLLKNYGFTNVRVIDGGNKSWKEAGCPMK